MNNATATEIKQLFTSLTQRYRTKKTRDDARIKFHLELDKIEGITPKTFRFINEAQMEFCYEYTRLRNLFNRPMIRRFTNQSVVKFLDTKEYLIADSSHILLKKKDQVSSVPISNVIDKTLTKHHSISR